MVQSDFILCYPYLFLLCTIISSTTDSGWTEKVMLGVTDEEDLSTRNISKHLLVL